MLKTGLEWAEWCGRRERRQRTTAGDEDGAGEVDERELFVEDEVDALGHERHQGLQPREPVQQEQRDMEPDHDLASSSEPPPQRAPARATKEGGEGLLACRRTRDMAASYKDGDSDDLACHDRVLLHELREVVQTPRCTGARVHARTMRT